MKAFVVMHVLNLRKQLKYETDKGAVNKFNFRCCVKLPCAKKVLLLSTILVNLGRVINHQNL